MKYLNQQLLIALFFITSFMSFAQVGVGTTDPKTTLDVVGKASTATALDGIMAPRLTADQLAAKTAYTAAQKSAIVYVDTAPTSTLTGAFVNVTDVGYYFFNGANWEKLGKDDASLYESGETIMTVASITPSSTEFTDIISVTLPSAGKYRLTTQVRSDLNASRRITYGLAYPTTAAGAIETNTSSLAQWIGPGTTFQGQGTSLWLVDAPAAGTYTLRAIAPSGGANVASNSSVGFTRLTWEKVAGFLPVINSPVIADNSASEYMDVGGMRMQWGVYAGGQTGAATATIIFPAAFANSNYALTATVQYPLTNKLFVVQTTAKTPTQFNFSKVYVYTDLDNKAYITGAVGEAFDWIAIGVKP